MRGPLSKRRRRLRAATYRGSPMGKRAGKEEGFAFLTRGPDNGGPALPTLADSRVTPVERFFVRSHADPPAIDPRAFRLEVKGLVHRPLAISLADLQKKFQRVTVEAPLICAGNRRRELASVAPIFGEVPWGPEAVGNARWTGLRLSELVHAVGPKPRAKHVWLTSLDRSTKGGKPTPFGGSIELVKARSAEVLLAYEMNGAPLRPDHGFPLRAVVPGYIGARSVKWLGEIRLATGPSPNPFQKHTYKRVPAGFTPAHLARARPLGPVELNCAIATPQHGDQLKAGRVRVRGYAIAPHGGRIKRVEVSGDGGRTWVRAQVDGAGGPWAWRLWRADIHMPRGSSMLVARATAADGAEQPETLSSAWNAGGYVNNAWHRVAVHAV